MTLKLATLVKQSMVKALCANGCGTVLVNPLYRQIYCPACSKQIRRKASREHQRACRAQPEYKAAEKARMKDWRKKKRRAEEVERKTRRVPGVCIDCGADFEAKSNARLRCDSCRKVRDQKLKNDWFVREYNDNKDFQKKVRAQARVRYARAKQRREKAYA